MTERQGVFRFELNESLYFESGQEVEEIIGVSLDPEISIQTFHEYVSIRGVIELSGDYHKVQLPHTLDEQPFEMDGYHERNFIEKVIDKTDSLAAFTHRFPVEISIPSYRVYDLEEVTVQVASFDYEIPNHHQMKLMAIIEIEGINEEVAPTHEAPAMMPVDEEMESEPVQAEKAEPEPEPEPEPELKPAEPVEAGGIHEKTPPKEFVEEVEEEEEDITEYEEEDITETATVDANKKEQSTSKKSLPLSDFFKSSDQKKKDEIEQTETDVEQEDADTVEVEDTEEPVELIKTKEQGKESEQSNTPIESLSDMFEHDTEEEYTRMRLCIVQDNDTIEKIAERYETTTKQLIIKNRLHDEDIITEGQLLYIPEQISK